MIGEENTAIRPSFKSNDRVVCIKDSPDCYLDREAGNAKCIAPLLYHVDNVVWSEKLGWLLSISGELHKAKDFISEASIVGPGYYLLEENESTLSTDERCYFQCGSVHWSWCTLPEANSLLVGITLREIRDLKSSCGGYPWKHIVVRRKIAKVPVKVKLWVRESDGMVIQADKMPEGFSELIFNHMLGDVFKLT